ncbi:hypothetical protein JG688_00004212 [Phytophthora aleatoria]|uniref:Uncharacterized protein n=1 Tax=Phytophthora aleatoria TaxID=2496075 RepID=A0A8J5MHA1_9STRA|nr:hypothetical protein JG688_00004212 [Phytophthora aleatoria]
MCLLDAVAWMVASGCTRQDHFSQCLCQTLRCLRLPARTAAKSEKYPGRQAVLEWFSLSSRKAPYCGVLARCHWQACSFMRQKNTHINRRNSRRAAAMPCNIFCSKTLQMQVVFRLVALPLLVLRCRSCLCGELLSTRR